jgi:hypothetical protein
MEDQADRNLHVSTNKTIVCFVVRAAVRANHHASVATAGLLARIKYEGNAAIGPTNRSVLMPQSS